MSPSVGAGPRAMSDEAIRDMRAASYLISRSGDHATILIGILQHCAESSPISRSTLTH